MNFLIRTTIILLLLGLAGCASSLKVKQLSRDGYAAFNEGRNEDALIMYEEIISLREEANRAVADSIYQRAGILAFRVNKPLKAIDYLVRVSQGSWANHETYFVLAQAYRAIDNLSLELGALRKYARDFPSGSHIIEVRTQLFQANVKSSNWEAAYEVWLTLDAGTTNNAEMLADYLRVIRRLGHDNALDVANRLLSLDSKNIGALEVLAEEYFRMAEDRYQQELKAYSSNKTNAQYRKLLSALEEVNYNFKRSRDYFERLYKMNPRPKYAFYLANIYTRFENKERAEYYKERAKGE